MLSVVMAASVGFAELSVCKPTETKTEIAVEKERIDTVGIATDPGSGNVLYCEWHTHGPGTTRVLYVTANGEVFAEKKLNFENGDFTPEYTQEDYRFGERHEVTLTGDTFTFFYQEDASADKQSTSIHRDKVDVIDAGFDAKTRAIWPALQSGDPVPIEFGSTVFQKTLQLRVIKKSQSHCSGWHNLDPKAHVCLKIEPDNWLIRVFFSGLELIYHAESKRLVQFEGPVNIKGSDQKKLSARIRYHYRAGTQ